MECIENFAKKCVKESLSDNTVSSYIRDIKSFCKYIENKNISLFEVKKKNVKEYIQYMNESEKTPATIKRNIISIRKFYNYLTKEKYLKRNPAIGVNAPKQKIEDIQYLSSDEIDKLLNFQPDFSEKSIRDKAMFEVIYATGINVSELVSLKICDVDLQDGIIRCSGAAARIIPIGNKAIDSISAYLKIRDAKSEYLFVNIYGNAMSRQGFWKILKSYKEKAGIDKEITPRILRRSLAIHLASNGMETDTLKQIMGLKSDISVSKYIETANHEIRNKYFKAHPRA